MEPIQRLLQVAEAASRAADPETARWFQDGLTAYLTDQNRPSMEKAFDLSSAGPGKPAARSRYMKQLRDMFLFKAYGLVDPGAKVMQRCEQLAAEIRAFEARIWPLWKDLAEPPATSSELRRLLYQAKRTGAPLPNSQQGVYQLLFQGREKIETPRFLF